MMIKTILTAVVFFCLVNSVSAQNYNFYLHNRANGWVINGFYTYQDGRWSRNWLTSRIQPGRNVPLVWNSQQGDCRVPFRVSWVDFGAQDFTMDWCRNNPTNIYMKDEGFSWD